MIVDISEVGCGPPLQVDHAEVQFSSTLPGSVAIYLCRAGYVAVPRATQSVCGVQGDWSQPPVCEGTSQEHTNMPSEHLFYILIQLYPCTIHLRFGSGGFYPTLFA